MIRFEFDATHRRTAIRGKLVIEIGMPEPVAGYSGSFACPIHISGVECKDLRSVGAFPFQAVDLALQIAKAVLNSYDREWQIALEDQGPITFEY